MNNGRISHHRAPVQTWTTALRIASATILLFSVAACQTTAPVWNDPNLAKCEKGIENAAAKFDSSVFKALQQCKDAYRTAVVSNHSLSTAAAACEGKLEKAIDTTNTKSAVSKALVALDALTAADKPCTDANLVALGHLSSIHFGDTWARLVLLNALRDTIMRQVVLVRDTANIFTELSTNGGCTTCATIATPPCATRTCTLSNASSINGSIASSMSGVIPVDICESPILPNDLGVFVGPAKSLMPLPFSPPFNICVTLLGGEGFIAKAGSGNPRPDYTMCQDHIVNAPDSNECNTGMVPVCSAAQPDQVPAHSGTTNGGECISMGSAAFLASPGDSLVIGEFQATFSDGNGADGAPCTDDDTTLAVDPPVPIAITTGTATAKIYDANNTNGSTLGPTSLTGTAFSIPQIESGSLSGGKWVATVPTIDLSGSGDSIQTMTLQCM